MATRDVELRLTQTGFDDVLAKIDELEAKLDELKAKFDDLSAKIVSPSVKLDGTDEADLQLDDLTRKLDEIGLKKVKADVGVNISGNSALKRLLSDLNGSGGGNGGSLAKDAENAGEGGGNSGGGFISGLPGNPYTVAGIGALVAWAASLLPALAPTAIGLGAGGLGGFAAYELNPAFQKAIDGLGTKLEKLVGGAISAKGPGGSPSFVQSISGMVPGIGSFIQSQGPELAQMFQASVPFLQMFVTLMENLVKTLLPVFVQVMKEIKPELPEITKGFEILIQGIGDFLKDLGPGMKDSAIVFVATAEIIKGILIGLAYVADALAIAFVKIAEFTQRAVDDIHDGWDHARRWTATAFDDIRHSVASAFDDIIHSVTSSFDKIGHGFTDGLHIIERAFDDAWGVLKVPPEAFFAWLYGRLHFEVQSIADIFNVGKTIWFAIWHSAFGAIIRDTYSWADNVSRTIATFVTNVISRITSFASSVLNSFTSLFTSTTSHAASFSSGIIQQFNSMVNGVVHVVTGLAGDVWRDGFSPLLNLAGRLASQLWDSMWQAGADIIHGLIAGVESALGPLWSLMNSVGNRISSFFKFALGIGSPSRVFYEHGQNIVRGLVNGLNDGRSMIDGAMSRISSAVAPGAIRGGTLAGAAAGGYGQQPIQIEFLGGSDSELWTMLKKQIRIRGGNPNVLGR